jgi:hypothetical protein
MEIGIERHDDRSIDTTPRDDAAIACVGEINFSRVDHVEASFSQQDRRAPRHALIE